MKVGELESITFPEHLMAESFAAYRANHANPRIRTVDAGRELQHHAELWMTLGTSAVALGIMLNRFAASLDMMLSFTVHRVKPFARPGILSFLDGDSMEWPLQSIALQWTTQDDRLIPLFPESADELWDPSHARELEAHGIFEPRIIRGEPLPEGKLVEHSARELTYADSVFKSSEVLDGHLLKNVSAGEGADGVYIVHEHATNLFFPVTDQSVIVWNARESSGYRESRIDVTARSVVRKRLEEFGAAYDMETHLDRALAYHRIARYENQLRGRRSESGRRIPLPMYGKRE